MDTLHTGDKFTLSPAVILNQDHLIIIAIFVGSS